MSESAFTVKDGRIHTGEQEYKILFKIDANGNLDPKDVKLLRKQDNFFVEISHLKSLSLTVHEDYVDFHVNTERIVEPAWR